MNPTLIVLFSSLRVKVRLYMFETMLHCEDQNQILGFYNKQGGNASNIYLWRAASPDKPPLSCVALVCSPGSQNNH